MSQSDTSDHMFSIHPKMNFSCMWSVTKTTHPATPGPAPLSYCGPSSQKVNPLNLFQAEHNFSQRAGRPSLSLKIKTSKQENGSAAMLFKYLSERLQRNQELLGLTAEGPRDDRGGYKQLLEKTGGFLLVLGFKPTQAEKPGRMHSSTWHW